jgi:hypothetical protein
MIILNGNIEMVIEMRKKNWVARAWGISIGQVFLGFIRFKRKHRRLK